MRKKKGDKFYPAVLEETERKMLKRARRVEGLDEEIALLRVKLALELSQHPKNTELLLKALPVLSKAMATGNRYSPGDSEVVPDEVLGELRELGKTLLNQK